MGMQSHFVIARSCANKRRWEREGEGGGREGERKATVIHAFLDDYSIVVVVLLI